MSDSGLRRQRQPLVHRAALVGLAVAEADQAQVRRVHHLAHGLHHAVEQEALAAMEQHRLVGKDQELVEGDAGRPARHVGRQAIDAVGGFVDARFH
jgi:hypothetical protein